MQRRKGDPTDIILVMIILFFVCTSLVVALYANGKLQEIISTTVLNESAAYSSINENFTYINQYTVQRAFVMFFGILIIGMMVSAFLVRVHPVFMFIYIITLIVAIFTSIYLANTYEALVSNEQFAAISANYETMTWVMQHVAIILLIAGALSMIVLFGKLGGGANQYQSDI